MPRPRTYHWLLASAVLAALGCGHSEPFVSAGVDQQGPYNGADPLRLTFNSDAEYGASWTADGKGILYSFADPSRADHDRCLAILPAAGGTRLFTLCDNRPGHADSAETIASGALSDDGELLYLVGASLPIGQLPVNITLFHADTAAPFSRRTLLTLPRDVGGGLRPNWLTDVTWVGPDEFVAMATDLTLVPQCIGCALRDTVFNPLGVVRGTIGGNGAAMELIEGTLGASHFAVADGGASLVISKGLTLSKLPRAGGALTTLTTLPATFSKRIDDISCRGSACVVLTYEQQLEPEPPPPFFVDLWTLQRISTAGGAPTILTQSFSTPWLQAKVSPTGSDVVVRQGPPKTGDLYLLRNLLP
ncbi:MAG: hypothetical protein V4558_01655 [Gemmatimonadota bacterium]